VKWPRLAAALSVMAAMALLSPASFGAWREPGGQALNVDPKRTSNGPDVAEVGGVPYASWAEYDGQHFPVHVARIESDGKWHIVGGPLNSATVAPDAQRTSIAAVGSTPYVAWAENVGKEGGQLRVGRLEGDGSWHLVSGAIYGDPAGLPTDPDIAAVGANPVPYVVWTEADGGSARVRLARLENGVWHLVGGPLYADLTKRNVAPRIAAVRDSAVPYVAWEEDAGDFGHRQVRVARLGTDDQWHLVGGLLDANPSKDAEAPSIAAVGGVIYVAWREDPGSRVARLGADGQWHLVGDVAGLTGFRAGAIAGVNVVPYVVGERDNQPRVARFGQDGKWHLVSGSLNAHPNTGGGATSVASIGGVPYVGFAIAGPGTKEQHVSRLEPDFLSQHAAPTQTGATLTTTARTFGLPFRIGFLYGGGFGQRTTTATASVDSQTTTVTRTVSGLGPGTTYSYRPFAIAGIPAPLALGPLGTFTPDQTDPAISNATATSQRFTYTLSERARVVFTIERKLPGRMVAGKCVKPTAQNANRPHCTRLKEVGSFAHRSPKGSSTVRFDARVGTTKLAPGAYRATLVATDPAGNASAPKHLAFTVPSG
jgi:hypothetical protein